MKEINDELWRSYRGIKYKFCSQQCLDRFVARTGCIVAGLKEKIEDKKIV
ncbi:MAG: hypothetical protein K6L80_03325 [Agarilytica sp.]